MKCNANKNDFYHCGVELIILHYTYSETNWSIVTESFM